MEYPKYVYQAAHDYDCDVFDALKVYDQCGEANFYNGMEYFVKNREGLV